MSEARKFFAVDEFLLQAARADAQGDRVDFVDGEIVQRASPSGRHARLESKVDSSIAPLFDRKHRPDGTGGWWIMSEASIQYCKVSEKGRILTADVAGWKRDRVPQCPTEYPIQARPDWVCEVSLSTRRKDTRLVPETLLAEGVPWYWLLDVENENLLVFEASAEGFVLKRSLFREDGKVRIPPFEGTELSIPFLLGDDADD